MTAHSAARAASRLGPTLSCLRPAPLRPGRRPHAERRRVAEGKTRCGWGGRLHGFTQPPWCESRRSWGQIGQLRAGDEPARFAGQRRPHNLAPWQLQPKAVPPPARHGLDTTSNGVVVLVGRVWGNQFGNLVRDLQESLLSRRLTQRSTCDNSTHDQPAQQPPRGAKVDGMRYKKRGAHPAGGPSFRRLLINRSAKGWKWSR